MIDRVLTYVRAVLAGKAQGDAAIGRYLMDTLGASTEGDADVGGSAAEMGGFNGRLQDTLMVSYLANLVRAQAEVSSRLALVQMESRAIEMVNHESAVVAKSLDEEAAPAWFQQWCTENFDPLFAKTANITMYQSRKAKHQI
ncbi:hypothetical protein GG344DRAFT_70025 [Lentinula edodes]|nr:hypothetical protein GG344DRAFT_70025 [Lentinula edodes]